MMKVESRSMFLFRLSARFNIAMDDALAISAVERHAALENDADNPVHRQQLVDPAVLLKIEALDVLHRQVSKIILNHGIKNPHDIRMIKPPGNHAFVLEQLAHAPRHRRRILAEADNLDGDLALGFRVIAEVDRSSRPLTQFTTHAVSAYRFHTEVM